MEAPPEYGIVNDLREYITRTTRATVEVYGPADTREGACNGRELICTCTGWRRGANALEIVTMLNAKLNLKGQQ